MAWLLTIIGSCALAGGLTRPHAQRGDMYGEGLKAYWPCFDTSDRSWNTNMLSLVGPMFVPFTNFNGQLQPTIRYPMPSCLQFGGTTQYAVSSSAAIADNVTNFTVCGWFCSTSDVSRHMVIQKMGSGGWSSGAGWGLIVDESTSGVKGITFFIQNLNGTMYSQVKTPQQNYNDSAWHFVAVDILNAYTTSAWRISVDGTSLALTDISGPGVTNFSNTSGVRLGNDISTANFQFGGMLSGWRFYSPVVPTNIERLIYYGLK